ncbi:MAG: filamentous hemagglutinin family protein [Rhodoplanes sp.]|uniref:filamentous haemagglutinin family protein n=1 Tax=Rhodoplanes sp. TaxID=1968906 RepID=UPI001804E969|nr:filamentous haemagglutinin family protein [Rhodoplanes sp.]NVO17722.1 filamentous hemagglutinin family protein [Rhodoplanes sp.]
MRSSVATGGAATSAAAAATAAAQSATQQAAVLAQRSLQSLQRAAQAAQAAQAAARAVATPVLPKVTDGLSPGGLIVDPRVPKNLAAPQAGENANLWINAGLPTSTTSDGRITVTVQQTAPQAVMSWQQFNIGSNTTLVFDQQGNPGWIALNRIAATGLPSQILGKIKADGTVLVINPNGIIFGAGSQVNVGSLIATTHDIASSDSARAFAANNPKYVLTSVTSGGTTTSFFVPPNEDTANTYFAQNGLYVAGAVDTNSNPSTAIGNSAVFAMGDQTAGSAGGGSIIVQPGAGITVNGTGTAMSTGYVALIGPAVTNAGTLTSTNGQVILAASNAVVLTQPATSATGVSTAMTVRPATGGYTRASGSNATASVVVDANGDIVKFPNIAPPSLTSGATARPNGGLVTNTGLIVSNDGAVTLVGDSIWQLGGILVTTSTSRPGSVTLDTAGAPTLGNGAIGNIVLGPASVIAILPDETSSAVPTSTVTPSYVAANIQPQITLTAAGDIDIQGNGPGLGGALVKAPGAAVTLKAGPVATGADSSLGTGGTIALGSGSTIDLSGIAGVTLPASDYLLTLKLTANEVADTPLARSLIGTTVTVDMRLKGTRADGLQWVGSPILDLQGYAGTTPQSIDRLLSVGGNLVMVAGQNVVARPGSSIDLSGGFVQYAAGTINTTRLLGSDGRVYDIGKADPGLSYTVTTGTALYHGRWNVSETFTNKLRPEGFYYPAYIAGSNAGTASITAVAPILENSFTADLVAGPRQRAGLDPMPSGARLTIGFATQTSSSAPLYTVLLEPSADAPGDPFGLANFQIGQSWSPTLARLADGTAAFPLFSDALTAAGFGSITIATGASVLSVSADATLAVRPGGSITLGNVERIDGSLVARSGSITLSGSTVFDLISPSLTQQDLTIGPTARLDVSGLWVNDTGTYADTMLGRAYVDGGSVTITTASATVQSSVMTIVSGTTTLNVDLAAPGTTYRIVAYTDATRSIVLAPGSAIDASSGGYVGKNGVLSVGSDRLPRGKGGNVTLETYVGGFNPVAFGTAKTQIVLGDGKTLPIGSSFYYENVANLSGPPPGPTDGVYRANTFMGGSIYAQGFDGGGTFTLQAPVIQIGGTGSIAIGTQGAAPGTGAIALPASFFTNNVFGAYSLIGPAGVSIAPGTDLVLTQSNLQVPSYAVLSALPTGTTVRSFVPLGVAPDAVRKPVSLTLTQDGFLNTSTGIVVGSRAAVTTDPGATVTMVADGPITLNGRIAAGALSTVTMVSTSAGMSILGGISAPGGTVNLLSSGALTVATGSLLDVAGAFVPDPKVTAYPTGTIYDGGVVTLIGSTVEVQPGSQIAFGGTTAMIAVPGQGSWRGDIAPQTIWSNGGTLQIGGGTVYLGGALAAAGGAPLAVGGTLTLGKFALPAALVNYTSSASAYDPNTSTIAGITTGVLVAPSGPATPATQVTVTADTLNNSGLSSVALAAGGTVQGSTPTGTVGIVGFAGNVSVNLPGTLSLFAGSGLISLLPAGYGLSKLSDAPARVGSIVNLTAGYVRLAGPRGTSTGPTAPKGADAILNIGAQWIDLQGALSFGNIGSASLTSSGPVRLLPANYGSAALASATPNLGGSLISPGRLTLTAQEIFPATATAFLLMSTAVPAPGDTSPTLTIQQYPNSTPTAPLSAGGTIVLDAQTIRQNGTLWAPLGNIVIGLQSATQLTDALTRVLLDPSVGAATGTYPSTAPLVVTQKVTFGSDGLTAVTAGGLDIPYGNTINGTLWYYGQDSGSTANGPVQQMGPPAKSISVYGKTIEMGGIVDASGGGDVYAVEFIAGSGGSRNALIPYTQTGASGATTTYQSQYADGRQVYALVPVYTAKIAAYDPVFSTFPYYSGQSVTAGALAKANATLSSLSVTPNSTDTLANSTGIAPGTQVTLTGGNGIAAGTYVLLPGMYATLPGAYRVVQVASSFGAAPQSIMAKDGSVYATGYLGNSLTGSRSSRQALFQLQSSDVWEQYSRIDITGGTSYFPGFAATNGVAVPALPVDGGLLVIGANTSLSLGGTYKFGPGTSDFAPSIQGASGQIDIAAPNIVVAASDRLGSFGTVAADGTFTARSAYSGYLFIDADQVSRLGASSVLIGGTASASAPGFVTAVAANLEVATDDAHPLTGPDLILVSQPGTTGLTVDAGSTIRAQGVASGASRDITLGSSTVSGDGALLRVSNGNPIGITRISTSGTGQIAIGTAIGTTQLVAGAGVTLDGGNSLIIDTSGSGTIAPDLFDSGGNTLARGVIIKGRNDSIAANTINFGAAPPGAAGLSLTESQFATLFADATTLTLRSRTGFNFYDQNGLTLGDPNHPIGTLTLDGAGLYGIGVNTAGGSGGPCVSACATIVATNIDLINSQGTSGPASGVAVGAGGVLTLNASGLITADVGAKTLAGFAKVNWNAGQGIVFTGTGSIEATAATATPVFNVGSVSVLTSGSGYTSVPTVTVAGAGGSGASATALLGVASITVSNGGSGYHYGDPVTITGPGGSGFTGTAIVNSTGVITGVNITSAGSGYTGAITAVSVTSSTGSSAVLTASLGVVGLSVVSAGSGYTTVPTVSFSGGGGTGATAQTLATITSLTLTNGGAGYQNAPAVTITGGGGSGGAASATLSGTTIGQATLTSGGAGYTSIPVVNIWGAPDITLSAPQIVVAAGAKQSLTTRGNLILQGSGSRQPDPLASTIGGTLALLGASVVDTSAPIYAWSGKLTLTAAVGDVVLNPGATISARGTRNPVMDQYLDSPGGTVQLISTIGNVTVAAGATVDVSNPYSNYAGSLLIQTGNNGSTGVATLNGTLNGAASFNDLGGNFSLLAGRLAGALPFDGSGPNFSGSFAVTLQSGDIAVPAGRTLTSHTVQLVANGGSVNVDGVIDARGLSGGQISLFGTGTPQTANGTTSMVGGVSIGATARLLASAVSPGDATFGAYSTVDNGATNPNGGTITLGTSGTPTAGAFDPTFGYELVASANSGWIRVAAGATLDVSGAPNAPAGQVIVRAPLLDDHTVNVRFGGSVVTNGSTAGGGLVLDAYATWSTADGCSLIPGGCGAVTTLAQYNALTAAQQAQLQKHFDGIVDPAGWFDGTSARVAGTVVSGNTVAYSVASTTTFTSVPTLVFSGGGGSGATATAVMNVQNGAVATTTTGSGFGATSRTACGGGGGTFTCYSDSAKTQNPVTVTLTGATGTGLAVSGVTMNADGTVKSVTIDNTLAQGYTAPVTLTVSASGATSATAQAKLIFVGINVTNAGTGYTTAPTLTVSGGGASGSLTVTKTAGIGQRNAFQLPNTVAQGTGIFVPTTAYAPHTAFYQTTLVGFVENPFAGTDGALAAQSFTGPGLGAILHLRPEVVLANPAGRTGVNGGNITVASNWNLGAVKGLKNASAFTATDGTSVAANTLITDAFGNLLAKYANYQGQLVVDKTMPLFYRTAAGEPGVLTLRAAGNLAINATLSDGFYETSDAFGGTIPVADRIANNPAMSGTIADFNTTAAAGLMSVVPGVNNGSFAFNLVGGAAFTSGNATVNPDAVVAVSGTAGATTGNVTINGHTTYPNYDFSGRIVQIPTLVRTGTGSITIAAAGNFQLLDIAAPGAVYTAGAAVATPDGFTAPVIPATYFVNSGSISGCTSGTCINGLVNTPTWASGGGAVTITTGQAIIGVQTPVDNSGGTQTGTAYQPMMQLWEDWYYHFGAGNGTQTPFAGCTASVTCQTAAWINYATFFQGIGALGGGNATLTAGGDITQIGVSLPETLVVTGGVAKNDARLVAYGGGNLVLQAGGNLNSSNMLVGLGSGRIRVAGTIASDPATARTVATGKTSSPTGKALGLILGVQSGFISAVAGGSVSVLGTDDPAGEQVLANTLLNVLPGAKVVPGSLSTANNNGAFGMSFSSYGPQSGVSVTSIGGDITLTLGAGTTLFNHDAVQAGNHGTLGPATLQATALSGSITASGSLVPIPTTTGDDTGSIDLLAAQSITLSSLQMPDLATGSSSLYVRAVVRGAAFSSGSYISPLGQKFDNLATALHANDSAPAVIVAGRDVSGSITLIKSVDIEAGNNLSALTVTAQNNQPGDITSLVAGNSIVGGNYVLYGPGTLLLQAGQNIGPFQQSVNGYAGVMTVGNGSNLVTNSDLLTIRTIPYLPRQSADIYVLFGVKPKVNYAATIAQYVDPAQAGTSGIDLLAPIAVMLGDGTNRGAAWRDFNRLSTAQQNSLVDRALASVFGSTPYANYMAAVTRYVAPGATDIGYDFLGQIAGILGLRRDDAGAVFSAVAAGQQALTLRQKLAIDRAFVDFLIQVGKDRNDPGSPYAGQYSRAYAAISTLFPAALGYTDNSTGSGTNGAATRISTGTMTLAGSVLETQLGGDINILSPGGNIFVGSNKRDTLLPNQEGILTLAGGTIRSFTDGTVQLGQSRIMTMQGGDIDLFTANGDLIAGEGPKTYAAVSPLQEICTVTGYCPVNPTGLVTGAGIAALVTLPGQDPTKSNANLFAPRGTIDAGAAGIRVAGTLNIAALQILNAFNIQVQGLSVGLPTVAAPPPVPLTTNANAAVATARTAEPAGGNRNGGDQVSIIIVEVLGYGGGDGGTPEGQPDNRRDRGSRLDGYDPNSAVHMLGNGRLTQHQISRLTVEERDRLNALSGQPGSP